MSTDGAVLIENGSFSWDKAAGSLADIAGSRRASAEDSSSGAAADPVNEPAFGAGDAVKDPTPNDKKKEGPSGDVQQEQGPELPASRITLSQ